MNNMHNHSLKSLRPEAHKLAALQRNRALKESRSVGKSIVNATGNDKTTLQLLETDPYGQVALELEYLK